MFANYYNPYNSALLPWAPWKLFQALTFATPVDTAAKPMTLAEAVWCIKPGDKVYITGNDGQLELIHQALYHRLLGVFGDPVTVFQLLPMRPTLYGQELAEKVRHVTPFPGSGSRKGDLNINNGKVAVIPGHLKNVPELLRNGLCPDVCIVHTSPPKGKYLHLAEGGIAKPAVEATLAKGGKVIAVINAQYPFLEGSCCIELDRVTHAVYVDTPPTTHPQGVSRTWEDVIAGNIASLLRDGDILQMGIGNVPKKVLRAVKARGLKNLSIYSEVLEINADLRMLIEQGVITGHGLQDGHYGHMVAGIVLAASQEDYAWLRENGHRLHVEPQDYVNCIGMQRAKRTGHRLVSINAGLGATVTGEIWAHTYGREHQGCLQSGWGGSNDFNRGADVSIVAFPATRTVNGRRVSNIQAILPEGTVPTYTGADVHYIVTEQGVAMLAGLDYQQRFERLMKIVAPGFVPVIAFEVERHIPYLRDKATAYNRHETK